MLRNRRSYALFVTDINMSMRGGDLFSLTASDVRTFLGDSGLLPRDQGKAVKKRRRTDNNNVREALTRLLASREYPDQDRVFIGQRGLITTQYLWKQLKKWRQTINLLGHYGIHTLRKTFGYHQHVTFGAVFGGRTKREILRYLSIKSEKIRSVYHKEL